MKNIVKSLIVLLAVLPSLVLAQTVENDLVGLGMKPEQAEYLAGILPAGSVLGNNTYLKARNAANSADISCLKVDGSDDTVVNADTGDVIKLSVAGTAEVTVDNDSLTFSGASAKIIPGATSLTFRNNANNADNLSITDAGVATVRAGLTVTAGYLSAGGSVTYPAALYETVAAAGTATGDGPLTAGKFIHSISASDETKVVTLPACAAGNIGEIHHLLNLVSNKFLKVCPITGSTLNGGGSGVCAAMGATGSSESVTCFCQAAATWICG